LSTYGQFQKKKIPQNLASSPFIFAQKSFVCMSCIGYFWGSPSGENFAEKKGVWLFYAAHHRHNSHPTLLQYYTSED
jgi:hypothetical protein